MSIPELAQHRQIQLAQAEADYIASLRRADDARVHFDAADADLASARARLANLRRTCDTMHASLVRSLSKGGAA